MTFLASPSRGRRVATGVELQEGRIVGPDSITGPRARPEESPPDRRTLGDYSQAAWRSKRSHPKAENLPFAPRDRSVRTALAHPTELFVTPRSSSAERW